MAEIKFEITKSLGVLSEGSRGWQKEINLVCWNERKPKIDIRDWAPEHEKMGKGITLNCEEIKKLKEILDSIDIVGLGLEP
ncbi:YdbC family protein [Pelotomaculum propionicicum]|uniref:YdbC family protein n=1 Tax=Pelotomaculum propionicicum TaxID=258475 RepID=UPI003B7CAEFC